MKSFIPGPFDFELLAYQQAGLAVAATLHSIPVSRLSLERASFTFRPKVSIEPFLTWTRNQRRAGHSPDVCAQRYAEALLAWSIGGLFCLEERYRRTHIRNALARLAKRLMDSAVNAEIAEFDLAFSIVFGWLQAYDEGNTEATLKRLWRQIRDTLRAPENLERIVRIAQELQVRRELDSTDLARLAI